MTRAIGGMATGMVAGLALMAGASDAAAQVTPEQVWNDFQTTYSTYGVTMTATTTVEGNGLRITDATGNIVLPAGLGAVTMHLPDMTLTDKGDGTVAIVMPEAFNGRVAGDVLIDDKVMNFSFDLTVVTRDAEMTVSGQPGDLTYRSTVGLYDVAMDNLRVTGLPDMEGVAAFVAVTIDDSDTTTRIVTSDARSTTDISSTAARTIIDFSIAPDAQTSTRSVSMLGASASTISISVPAGPFDLMNMAAALRNGLAFDLTSTTFDQTAETVVYLSGERVSAQNQTIAEARQQFSLSQDGLAILSQGSGIVFDIPADEYLPLPIRVALDEGNVSLTMPVSASDAPQDFGLGLALRGVTLSDDLWGLIDATGTLPRDPATFDLAMAGQVNLAVDLFDFNALTGPAMLDRMDRGDMPAQVTALSMPRLVLNGAGMALTGNGSFVIDNSDLVTFDGLPKPVGRATFDLTGANGLIDDLTALGLIGPDEAMGARMGMAMVGRATGDDAMTSIIEINEAGHLIVNGLRMQ